MAMAVSPCLAALGVERANTWKVLLLATIVSHPAKVKKRFCIRRNRFFAEPVPGRGYKTLPPQHKF
jgi:hypothetical protein